MFFQVRRSVRAAMRMLGSIYSIFRKEESVVADYGNCLDIFRRINFKQLRQSIDIYTSKHDDTVKAGLKQNLFYLLKRAAKTLRALMLEEEKVDVAEEVGNFRELLELWDDIIFGDAVYEINRRREVYLRKPEQLPNESDMMIIKDHILQRMKDLTTATLEFFSSSNFVELRDIVLSRLIIINGRRNGEPSKLTIEDWNAAKRDEWINKDQLTFLDDFDMALVNSLKITYITGKGIHTYLLLLVC